MSESNTRAEIVEVMARRFRALGLSTAEAQRGANEALHALESSGRAVVPRRALEQIVNLSDCGFAVDVAEQALAAALPPSKE